MSIFSFKHFTIKQDIAAVKVGTDAMLLGAFANVSDVKKVLEIGTGTGVISLMLAQKNPSLQIIALEIHAETAKEAAINIANSIYFNCINIQHQDFLNFAVSDKFDVVVTNPPYFECGVFPEDLKLQIAKHIDRDKMDAWFCKISIVLDEAGSCWMILPFEASNAWIELANKYNLYVDQRINVYAKPTICKRVIICFSKISKNIVQQDFVIREASGDYSLEYIELTKDFHDRIPIR
jgi:tRNA1Val (adenine37-N6)-methyltransferase